MLWTAGVASGERPVSCTAERLRRRCGRLGSLAAAAGGGAIPPASEAEGTGDLMTCAADLLLWSCGRAGPPPRLSSSNLFLSRSRLTIRTCVRSPGERICCTDRSGPAYAALLSSRALLSPRVRPGADCGRFCLRFAGDSAVQDMASSRTALLAARARRHPATWRRCSACSRCSSRCCSMASSKDKSQALWAAATCISTSSCCRRRHRPRSRRLVASRSSQAAHQRAWSAISSWLMPGRRAAAFSKKAGVAFSLWARNRRRKAW
mmetsp:Transcript_659/g.1621  ORF Transcript_659/g.1621 Transcript_659/m.1621 type:complete len:264 (-) Transcript_659:754-1545(-)